MKATPLLLFAVTLAATAVGQNPAAPLPRARLDPAGRAVVQAAPKYDPTVGPSPALMMERFVVKDHALLLRTPQQPAPAKGPFTILNGGAMSGRNLGPFRAEVGMTPYYDILAFDTRFKPPSATVRYGLFNLSW